MSNKFEINYASVEEEYASANRFIRLGHIQNPLLLTLMVWIAINATATMPTIIAFVGIGWVGWQAFVMSIAQMYRRQIEADPKARRILGLDQDA